MKDNFFSGKWNINSSAIVQQSAVEAWRKLKNQNQVTTNTGKIKSKNCWKDHWRTTCRIEIISYLNEELQGFVQEQ